MKLVNIGCGSTWHPDWINLDLIARDPGVRRHDLREGLPFGEGTVDACYSSHVLEHLEREEADFFIGEQRRVLKSGGVIRVAVPDLEQICRNYLAYLERSAEGEEDARFRHEYSYLELYDQATRTRSGGRLGELWSSDLTEREREFIRERHGEEALRRMGAEGDGGSGEQRPNKGGGLREKLAKAAVRLLGGKEALEAFREGLFRRSGEVHREMYDRCRLGRLLESHGFGEISVVGAEESRIPGFASYELDAAEGRPRKPDSLYMEAVGP